MPLNHFRYLGLGALTGFALVYLLVPPTRRHEVPAVWFSLPGRPIAVNGAPVDSWEEANAILRRSARSMMGRQQNDPESEAYSYWFMKNGTRPPEVKIGEMEVVYVPAGSGRDGEPRQPTKVVVRAWQPVTVDYGRMYPSEATARFELVRPDPIE
jgi:hypothetical protein